MLIDYTIGFILLKLLSPLPILTVTSILTLLPATASADIASFYGERFHNKMTASGEVFNMHKMTCASNTHKMGTRLKVTNKANGKSILVTVNDRGGFSKYGRTLDLSKAAFSKIADVKQGLAKVDIKVVK